MQYAFYEMLEHLLEHGESPYGSVRDLVQSSDLPVSLIEDVFILVQGARTDAEKVLAFEPFMARIRDVLETRLIERMEQRQREFASDCYDGAYP